MGLQSGIIVGQVPPLMIKIAYDDYSNLPGVHPLDVSAFVNV